MKKHGVKERLLRQRASNKSCYQSDKHLPAGVGWNFITLRSRRQGWEQQGRATDSAAPGVCTAPAQGCMVRLLPATQGLHCTIRRKKKGE